MKGQQLRLFDFDDKFNLFSQIDTIFPNDESFGIEFKSGMNGFPKELWKTYSAYANTNTGIIVIGVKENKKGISIEGLSD